MKSRSAVLAVLMTGFLIVSSTGVDVGARPGGGGGGRPAGGAARPSGGGGARASGRSGGGARAGSARGGGGMSSSSGGAPRRSGGAPSRSSSGFSGSFNQDFSGRTAVPRPGTGNRNTSNRNTGNRNTRNRNTTINGGNRTNIVAPVVPAGPAWGWNGGVAWYPAPTYWGGGFWGPFAAGVATTALFGAIVDSGTHEQVVSYEVAPDSPGAKALKAYGLMQAECKGEGSGQVVIFGPNDSVVCASPNSTVAAGQYELDTSNLTIYSK